MYNHVVVVCFSVLHLSVLGEKLVNDIHVTAVSNTVITRLVVDLWQSKLDRRVFSDSKASFAELECDIRFSIQRQDPCLNIPPPTPSEATCCASFTVGNNS